MKRISLTLFSLAIAFFAVGQDLALNTKSTPTTAAAAVFKWTTTTHDFGKIKVGVPVEHEFTFTNKGSIPLVISSVQASCGCTVTAYSKEPIEPNGKGFVKATYNAAQAGQFSKTVSVSSNTAEGIVQLTIKGEVIK